MISLPFFEQFKSQVRVTGKYGIFEKRNIGHKLSVCQTKYTELLPVEKTPYTRLLIFVPEINPRIRFIVEFIFQTILGIEVSYTTDSGEFVLSGLPKINYSQVNISSGLFLKAHTILFRKGIVKQDLVEVNYQEQRLFFPSSEDSFLPFDPFACSFYLLTRYEEYLPGHKDEHERFPDSENILVRLGMNHKPVVDQIALWIADKLSERFPEFKITPRTFRFMTTIDIDNAFAYKNKTIGIGLGAACKAVMKGQGIEIRKRMAVLFGLEKDPYDTYDYILETYKGCADQLQFFILLGDRNPYDKNISHKNKRYRQLIGQLAEVCKTGIHPSYASNRHPDRLKTEKERLEEIIQKPVTQSRQHYLKLKFPETYQSLIKAGLTDDYTMGFAGQIGFRAGTCTAFPFFDLSANRSTELMIHPFHVMDVALKNYMSMSPDEAWRVILELMLEVKKVNGTFISLWHNESLSDSGQWQGWQKVFEQMTETGLKLEHE